MRISKELHRQRMVARRLRQRARAPGFTPMSNKRVDKAFNAAILLAAIRKPHLGVVEQRQEALRMVAAQLPKAQPSKVAAIQRLIARGSRNDDAAYREAGYCDRPRVAMQAAAQ